MLAKACAAVLVALCAAPVTAPFSAIDLASGPSARYGIRASLTAHPVGTGDDLVIVRPTESGPQPHGWASVDLFVPDHAVGAARAAALRADVSVHPSHVLAVPLRV